MTFAIAQFNRALECAWENTHILVPYIDTYVGTWTSTTQNWTKRSLAHVIEITVVGHGGSGGSGGAGNNSVGGGGGGGGSSGPIYRAQYKALHVPSTLSIISGANGIYVSGTDFVMSASDASLEKPTIGDGTAGLPGESGSSGGAGGLPGKSIPPDHFTVGGVYVGRCAVMFTSGGRGSNGEHSNNVPLSGMPGAMQFGGSSGAGGVSTTHGVAGKGGKGGKGYGAGGGGGGGGMGTDGSSLTGGCGGGGAAGYGASAAIYAVDGGDASVNAPGAGGKGAVGAVIITTWCGKDFRGVT